VYNVGSYGADAGTESEGKIYMRVLHNTGVAARKLIYLYNPWLSAHEPKIVTKKFVLEWLANARKAAQNAIPSYVNTLEMTLEKIHLASGKSQSSYVFTKDVI